jgi:hypothetical protein
LHFTETDFGLLVRSGFITAFRSSISPCHRPSSEQTAIAEECTSKSLNSSSMFDGALSKDSGLISYRIIDFHEIKVIREKSAEEHF